MRDGDINYSNYTLAELKEALSGINRDRYPNNYANLCAAHQKLTGILPVANDSEQIKSHDEIADAWPGPTFDENGRYVPNRFSRAERVTHVILSLLLLAYGSYGVWVNDLYVPSKRRGMHLHDVPAWIMYGAVCCACLVMFSVVVDHYDRRNNEAYYRRFASIGEFVGWSFFGLSLLWALLDQA